MKFKSLLLSALCLVAVGCSHTKLVGTIGNTEIHKVSLRGLDGPNITALVTKDKQTGEVKFVETASGPGIGPALVSAVGNTGSAAAGAALLRPARTHIRTDNTSGAAGTGGDASGSAAYGGFSNATGGAGGAGGSGAGYGSAGATSSSNTQSSSYSGSDSW